MVMLTLAVPLYENIHYSFGEIGIASRTDSELTKLPDQAELLFFSLFGHDNANTSRLLIRNCRHSLTKPT